MGTVKKVFLVCIGLLLFSSVLALSFSQGARWVVADILGIDYENRIDKNIISSMNDFGKVSSDYHITSTKFDYVSFELDVTNYLNERNSYIAFSINQTNQENIKDMKISLWESWIHPKKITDYCTYYNKTLKKEITEECGYHWEDKDYYDFKSYPDILSKVNYNGIEYYIFDTHFKQDEIKKLKITLNIERFSKGEFDVYYFPNKDIQQSLSTKDYVFIDPTFSSFCTEYADHWKCTGDIDASYFDAGAKAIYIFDAYVKAYGIAGANGDPGAPGTSGNITLHSTLNITIRNSTISAQGGAGGSGVGDGANGGLGGSSRCNISSPLLDFNDTLFNVYGMKGGHAGDGIGANNGGLGGNAGSSSCNITAININFGDDTKIKVSWASYGGNGGRSDSGQGGDGGNAGKIHVNINATNITAGDNFEISAGGWSGGEAGGCNPSCDGGDGGDSAKVSVRINATNIVFGNNGKFYANTGAGGDGGYAGHVGGGTGGDGGNAEDSNLEVYFNNFTTGNLFTIQSYSGDKGGKGGSGTGATGSDGICGTSYTNFKGNKLDLGSSSVVKTSNYFCSGAFVNMFLNYELSFRNGIDFTAKSNRTGDNIINLTGSNQTHRRLGLFDTYIPEQYDVWSNSTINNNITFGFNGREDWNITWHVNTINLTYYEYFDIPAPVIDLQVPKNNFYSPVSDIDFTYNVTTINNNDINNCSLYLKKAGSWERNMTDLTITKDINQTFNISLEDINILWHVGCYDNATVPGNSSSSYNLTIDTIFPSLTLYKPSGDHATLNLPTNITLNYSATDINLDSCYYNTSDSATQIMFTCNTETNVAFSSGGDKTIWYYVNDSSNNEDFDSIDFYIYSIQTTVTESRDPIGEGVSNIITLEVNLTNVPNTFANLIWNGTNYGQGTKVKVANDLYRFTNTFTIPFGIGSITGATVPYNYTYNITGIINHSINGTQTLYKMDMDNCSTYTDVIVNYTLKKEELQTKLTGTIETHATVRSYSNSSLYWDVSSLNTNINSIALCVPSNILDFGDYLLGIVTRYEANGYVIEYHYIDHYNLTNTSSTQYVTLHDLNESDSTSFLITYKNEYYLPVESAIIDVWRYYIGDGNYKSVEMGKTDKAGHTRAHLVVEDVKYIFYVRVDGVLVHVSPEYLALCQATPCQINLYEDADTTSDYDKIDNIAYTFDLDEDSRTVTFTYMTTDGSSATMGMNITLLDAYANTTACSESETSSGGTITCTVAETYKDSTYIVDVYKDGEFVTYRSLNLNPDPFAYFGYTGVFLTFLLFLTLTLMAISSGAGIVIFGIVGLIVASMLSLFSGGSILGIGSSIMWVIVAGIIILYKISQRRYS